MRLHEESETHEKIISYVNRVLAHQDNVESSKHSAEIAEKSTPPDHRFQRFLSEVQKHEDGFEWVIVLNSKGHVYDLTNPIIKIKKELLLTYRNKFDKELPIIYSYEPLEHRK